MSWLHKDKDIDYAESAVKYCQSMNDKSRVKLQKRIAQLEKENEELKKVSTDILLDRAPATGYLPSNPSFSTIVANISVVERSTRYDPAPRSQDAFVDINHYITTYVTRIYLGKVIVGTIYYNRYYASVNWCEPTYTNYISSSFETVEILNEYKALIENNIEEYGKFVYDNASKLAWRYKNYVGNSANNIQN